MELRHSIIISFTSWLVYRCRLDLRVSDAVQVFVLIRVKYVWMIVLHAEAFSMVLLRLQDVHTCKMRAREKQGEWARKRAGGEKERSELWRAQKALAFTRGLCENRCSSWGTEWWRGGRRRRRSEEGRSLGRIILGSSRTKSPRGFFLFLLY